MISLAESILICSRKEVELVQKMFEQDKFKPILSCFLDTDNYSSFKRALLEIITSGIANTNAAIVLYIKSTFFYTCAQGNTSLVDEQSMIDKCLPWLCDNELIRSIDQEEKLRYEPTPLALAVMSSSINPDDGLKLVVELNKAQRNLCLENDLHLVYLVSHISLLFIDLLPRISTDHSSTSNQYDVDYPRLECFSYCLANCCC